MNNLAEEVTNLAEEVKNLAKEVNSLSEEVKYLAGEVNNLSEEVNIWPKRSAAYKLCGPCHSAPVSLLLFIILVVVSTATAVTKVTCYSVPQWYGI